jgi:tetrahydromethanopterin S-methyltransferase subunit G
MTPFNAQQSVPERLGRIEEKLNGIQELLEQRIVTLERSVGRVYWIGGVLFTAIFGVFIEHIFTR